MNKKVLIIDDDEKLNSLLRDYLAKFGLSVIALTDPAKALKRLNEINPDIVILDIMLPGINGFEVCKLIRRESMVPVIMLTARGELTDRVAGLELGADDYMPKPFEPRELAARISSILRRAFGHEKAIEEFGTLQMNYGKMSASINGIRLDLSASEFTLLAFLCKNRGIIVSREMIFDKIKGPDDASFDRSIDVMISRIRRKLSDVPDNPSFIKTVRGAGYMFIGGE